MRALLQITTVACGLAISAGAENLAAGAKVSASGFRPDYPPAHAVDGIVSDASRWLAEEEDEVPWLEIRFAKPAAQSGPHRVCRAPCRWAAAFSRGNPGAYRRFLRIRAGGFGA